MGEKSPKELFKERNQRVKDAIAIKEPDRVPITPMVTFYPTEQAGMSKKEALYESQRAVEVAVKLFSDSNWDQVPPIHTLYPAQFFDILDAQFFKWPGAKNEKQRVKDPYLETFKDIANHCRDGKRRPFRCFRELFYRRKRKLYPKK